jgi:antitoxin HigA-1
MAAIRQIEGGTGVTDGKPRIGEENDRLVRVLACAVDNASRPRGQIAEEAGMHRQTLMKLVRGERVIKLEDAARILAVCGVPVRSTLMLALSGQEQFACQWMHHEVGLFLEEFLTSLPPALDQALGDRSDELRPKWAKGTSQLVARMLADHIDDFASREVGASMTR